MTVATTAGPTQLDWDDLLDDYEDRIDDLLDAIEQSRPPAMDPFVRPNGSNPPPPTAEQMQRLISLQQAAEDAANRLAESRLESNRATAELRKESAARRRYAAIAKL